MNNIDELLRKYFEGETTLDEENVLRDYFLSEEVEEQYRIYAPMFNFFSEEIDKKESPVIVKKRRIPSSVYYAAASIAACICILIGFKTFNTLSSRNDSKSLVYINGERITDMEVINNEALLSIQNISDMDEDIVSTQIDILDSFTE